MKTNNKQFLAVLESMDFGANSQVVERAAARYAIDEGLINKISRAINPKPIRDPYGLVQPDLPINMSERQINSIPSGETDFEKDYGKLRMYSKAILHIINDYGGQLINQWMQSYDFLQAKSIGDKIDMIRPNPLAEAVEKRRKYMAFLESMKTGNNASLVSDMMKAYVLTEAFGIDTDDDDDNGTEAIQLTDNGYSPDAEAEIKKFIDCMEVFMRKHGSYPVLRFLHSQEYRQADTDGRTKRANHRNIESVRHIPKDTHYRSR